MEYNRASLIIGLLIVAVFALTALILQLANVVNLVANISELYLFGILLPGLGLGWTLIYRGFTKKGPNQVPTSTEVSQRIQRNGGTIQNQRVTLDGHVYRNVHFQNCSLLLDKGDFELHDCIFDSCKWIASGNAETILRVNAMLGGTGAVGL